MIVDKNSVASSTDIPWASILSWHILKNRFTSAATGFGRSCEDAPRIVHGHMWAFENAVPRNALAQTRFGFGSFANSLSILPEVRSAQRRTTSAARSSFVG